MIVDSSFRPAWWLRSGHAQTIWPALFRAQQIIFPVQRERIHTPDNDFIDLDWYGPPRGPIVILLHGLTGSSRSPYIQGLQQCLANHGLRSAALNFRGCSHTPNQLARGYHCGETGDLDFVFRQLQGRYQERIFAIIGFSLGANVLLKWLGEPDRAHQQQLPAAVAVSPPFRLDLCADRMDRGLSRLYRNLLIGQLKNQISQKMNYLEQNGHTAESGKLRNLGDLGAIRSFWEFDNQVIARLYGFDDASDYYRRVSSRQFLCRIRSPALIIHAMDDPFMVPEVVPHAHEVPDNVTLELSRHGGHLGFMQGNIPGKPEYWLEKRIPEYLQLQLTDRSG